MAIGEPKTRPPIPTPGPAVTRGPQSKYFNLTH